MENSLQNSPAEDHIPLSVAFRRRRPLIGAARHRRWDYHHQLETYGRLIRQIHHARVSAPPLMGWWSWTAYYFGLNEGAALSNAQWQAEHLNPYGYDLFHIDEGYQFARGEYTTPNATVFPHGLGPGVPNSRPRPHPRYLDRALRGLRALLHLQQHRDWLVKNAQGQPIPAGSVEDGKDQLYILDVTNPGALLPARNLRQPRARLGHPLHQDGFHGRQRHRGLLLQAPHHGDGSPAHRPAIIRDTVGDNVFLDKDGSAMLNPVGYVDYGRVSQDTGHSFDATREAEPGIAARYYMDRNYFVSDPDAFTVSTQSISDQTWHEAASR